ncbi:MAG: hypothetical protein K6F29_02640 [Bacteroidales bacterium]|nr:hypothetical protein [Bacteroidales bacterium]
MAESGGMARDEGKPLQVSHPTQQTFRVGRYRPYCVGNKKIAYIYKQGIIALFFYQLS